MGIQKPTNSFGLLSIARRAGLTCRIESAPDAFGRFFFTALHDGNSSLCPNSNKGKNRPNAASPTLRGANLHHLLQLGILSPSSTGGNSGDTRPWNRLRA